MFSRIDYKKKKDQRTVVKCRGKMSSKFKCKYRMRLNDINFVLRDTVILKGTHINNFNINIKKYIYIHIAIFRYNSVKFEFRMRRRFPPHFPIKTRK